jgi:hypothetical protein
MRIEGPAAFALSAACFAIAAWAEGPCFTDGSMDPCSLMSEPDDGCPDTYYFGNSCPWAHDSADGLSENVPVTGQCLYSPSIPSGGQCNPLPYSPYNVTCHSAGGSACGDQGGDD